MLFVLYVDPSRVKFTEYIAHLIVRATSPAKARQLAREAYPKHPIDLNSDFMQAAQVEGMRLLEPVAGITARAPLYFCDENVPEADLRALAAELGAECDRDIWLDPTKSAFRSIAVNGKATLLARTENRTPQIAQRDLEHPIFCWKVVTDRWPNPDEDPIALKSPPSLKLHVQELDEPPQM
jgi:hypothetical protein